mmetsp:Transcript_29207/g.38420  ORF Transcript_29207/g.38420 Transcript_29207/m.38420 type:complete len:228 (+) Transcript_29207:47-730(+)
MSKILEKIGLKQKPDPIEQAKEWKKSVRKESRGLERQIREIERTEKKVEKEIKQLAKQNQIPGVKVLAKNLVEARRAKDRLYSGRAQLNSLGMQIQNSIAMMKVAGAIETSADVMHSVNGVLSIPELRANMMDMAREMERAGLIEEILEDTFDIVEGDGLAEEADLEVEKVIAELTEERLSEAEDAPTALPAPAPLEQDEEKLDEVAETSGALNEEEQELRARLDAL